MFGVPPNTLPMVLYIRIFATGYYCIRTWHSKQFLVGLMVLSDGLVYFLKIKNFLLLNPPKLSCGFHISLPLSLHPGH